VRLESQPKKLIYSSCVEHLSILLSLNQERKKEDEERSTVE
jgi:hypothetical protein